MIIAERRGFAFIHIPKCAGSSVRRQIEAFDDEAGFFSRVRRHPELGTIDYGHLTLPQLRTHFPDAYTRLRRLDCYAVCRDPLARFGSALRQSLWMYDKRPMTLIPPAELTGLARRMVDDLDRRFDHLPHRYVFFTPQRDYVFNGDERVIDHLYPIEATDRFIVAIGARVGAWLDPERHSNRNVELRYKRLGPALFRINDLLRRRLSDGAHARLKRFALGLVARKEDAAVSSGVTNDPAVRDFVHARYAADFALHRAALAEFTPADSVAALAT